ncbi:MAG: division/cell wall cluster transcriptional repressor MraZ [Actinomycetota bacterium]|nr:division/cell wall cluster transcriptional repressor MraZ [Actinomycetota bacterium]
MFLGTHTPRLDDKGRLALPARFRPELAGGLVLTKGQERCLFAFSLDEFQRITEAMRATPTAPSASGPSASGPSASGPSASGPSARAARDNSRVFFASASQETLDGQGRVTIPAPLRSYAGLTKECAVIGANTRVEIWDAAAWEAYLADREPAFAEADEEVLPGLL